MLPVRTAASSKRPASTAPNVPNSAPVGARKSAHAAAPTEEPYALKSNEYYEIKQELFNAFIEIVDVVQITKMNPSEARLKFATWSTRSSSPKKFRCRSTERQELIEDICNDVLGYGPLEPLLARDDIADIMVNGNKNIFIEVDGKVRETNIRFRDHSQLLNVCQRIVSQIGRRVDESSPICDARLPDGSRVNVIVPPLAVDGTTLTIRKFKKDKLTLDQLIRVWLDLAARRGDPQSDLGEFAAMSLSPAVPAPARRRC